MQMAAEYHQRFLSFRNLPTNGCREACEEIVQQLVMMLQETTEFEVYQHHFRMQTQANSYRNATNIYVRLRASPAIHGKVNNLLDLTAIRSMRLLCSHSSMHRNRLY